MRDIAPSAANDVDPPGSRSYFVYILECVDGTLYTGITVDVERRVREHNSSKAGARYTAARRPVTCVYAEARPDRSSALKREHAIKQLSRDAKLKLVATGGDALETVQG